MQFSRFNLVLYAVTVSMITLFLGSCLGAADESDILIIGTTGRITELSPANSYNWLTWHVLRQTTNALVAIDPETSSIVPSLAKSWEVSSDGTTYTFHLREKVTFWDGAAFNAEAMKWSLERSLRLDGPQSAVNLLRMIKNIWCSDSSTLKIRIDSPDATFLARLTDSMAPSLALSPRTTPADHFANGVYAGTGPYKLVEYVPDQYVEYRAYADYWGPAPKTKTIFEKFYSDTAAIRAALEAGDIDVAYFSPGLSDTLSLVDISDLQRSPDLKVITGGGLRIRYLVFTVTKPPFDNYKVRQGIAYAVDREAICDQVFLGVNKPLYSMIPPELWSHIDAFPKKNLTKAETLLRQAGYSTASPLKITLWYTSRHYGTREADAATVIKESLEETGLIKVDTQVLEWPAYVGKMSHGELGFFLLGWGPDFIDPDNFLSPWLVESPEGVGTYLNNATSSYDRQAYSQFVKLLGNAKETTDVSERTAFYEEAQRLLAESAILIPLWNVGLAEVAVTQKDVQGVVLDAMGGFKDQLIYRGLANVPPAAEFTSYMLSASGARLLVQPKVGKRVWFDASGSSDPDGTVVKYTWDWDSDGEIDATTKDPVIGHIFLSSGTHRVTLQVTDDKGGTATATKTVTIGEKQPPSASFTYHPAAPSILDTVEFTDSSSDPDGEIKSWKWEFGDGSSSTVANPTHQYTQKKRYTVKLTVTDDDGLTDVITKQLTVTNLIPTASFSFSPQQAYVNQPVSFDASSSTDKDGTITNYAWDFTGDGTTDTQGEKATWTFAKDGTYTVTLTVTDDDGAVASDEEKITVNTTPPGPPKFNDEWGLVVGIADYQDPSITDLQFTEDDAQAFYDFLTDTQGGGFPKDHVRLLLGKDATLIGMRKGLDWLSNVAGPDDLVVFYYAGHGATVPDKNHDEAKVNPGDTQDECLVPYDADYSSLAATTLVDDAIGYWFSNLSSQHVLMVFDSCFSGGASREVRSFGKGGARAAAGNAVFTDMSGAGRIFLAASRADQSSFENGTLKHGVFTYFLLRGLGDKDLPEVEGLPPISKPEADKDGDGRVTVKEMEAYLDAQVPPFVRQHENGGEQDPVIRGDENLRDIRLDGYGVPLVGEVTAIQGQTVIISLGSRQGIQPGDRFEVIRPLTLPDGTVVNEVEATIEVLYILGPDRAGCKIVESLFPIAVKDEVHPAQ